MPTYLITGATGQQGGATISALLASHTPGLRLRALTRNPDSAAAQALAKRGVTLVKGDFTDRASLESALKGVDGAHLVTDFRGKRGAKEEVEQGKTFLEGAKERGVKHIVYSSVAGADTAASVPHFNSKFLIEEYLRKSRLPYTILRPTNFMENTPPPGIGRFFMVGTMKAIFGTDRVYHIACEDIGRAAATALLEPGKHSGKVMDLVSEIATVDEMQRSLDRAEGYPSWSAWVPRGLVMAVLPKEFSEMFKWLSETYKGNAMPGSPEELKAMIGDVTTIESWGVKQRAEREAVARKLAG